MIPIPAYGEVIEFDDWGGAVAETLNLDSAVVTSVVPAANFAATLVMVRGGSWALMNITIERIGANLGATSVNVATVGVAGRGSFTSFTQPLNLRSAGASALEPSIGWYDANTGVFTIKFPATWNTGVVVSFTGLVFLG